MRVIFISIFILAASVGYGQAHASFREIDSLQQIVIRNGTLLLKVQDFGSMQLKYLYLYMDTKDEKYLRLEHYWHGRMLKYSNQLERYYKK